jgi:hypothetical protein
VEKVPFYREDLDRSSQNHTNESLSQVIDLLNDPRLGEEIAAGNITLAMIRPNVGPEANNLGLEDIDAAEKIEEMIEGLGVLAKFSILFSQEAAEEFYGGGPEVIKSTNSGHLDSYSSGLRGFSLDILS